MPKRSRSSRSTKRRSKRRRFTKRKPRVPRGLFSKKHYAVLRYTDTFNLSPNNTGTLATYSYYINSLYDPQVATGGHQPMGYDQYMLFYNHYTVVGAKVTAEFMSTAADVTGRALVTIEKSGSLTATTSQNDLKESGRGQYRYVQPVGSANCTVRMTSKASVKKMLSQNPLAEDQNAGTETTNPQELLYWHFGAASPNNATIPATIQVMITIHYAAVFHEQKVIQGS